MINTQNYFKEIRNLDVLNFPDNLKEGYIFTEEATEDHKNWNYYNSDKDVKETIDEYIDRLNKYLSKNKPRNENQKLTEKDGREAAKKLIFGYVERGDSEESIRAGQMGSYNGEFNASIKGNKIFVEKIKGENVDFSFPLHSIYNEIKEELGTNSPRAEAKKSPKKQVPKKVIKPIRIDSSKAKPVERVSEEVKFIKRFTLLHGKRKTVEQILNFINSLNRAAIERRIRKTSPYANEIRLIQKALKQIYENMGKSEPITIDKHLINKFMAISGSEKVRLSITYMKRYVGIQGKNITKEKAKKIYNLIGDAINNKKITSSDPYFDRIRKVLDSLKHFISVAKTNEKLSIHETVLSGINTALGCECIKKKEETELAGIEPVEKPPTTRNKVMNSVDFANLKFDTIGFMGKWLAFIGDPSPGFSAMATGRPKYGKSYLCVEFAGYLARHHGNVLYVAKEEKLDFTLQKKLNETKVQHPCLFVSDFIPDDLSKYDFIFLDSVNKLGLKPEDIEKLKEKNPGKSFIAIYQTRKDGMFKGDNQNAHDPDIIIEFPEKGKAIQYGRFNQGGEMKVFE